MAKTAQAGACEASDAALAALGAEIVDLFYAQMAAPAEYASEGRVCRAFADMLLRHWELCGVSTYLRAEDGSLRASAVYTHPHLGDDAARQATELLAARVNETGRELQVWVEDAATATGQAGATFAPAADAGATDTGACAAEQGPPELRAALAAKDLRAGVGLPIRARGSLAGVLVALSGHPERLRAALAGLRFVAAPILIALGNARQAAEMRAQHARIEQLVEELQARTRALEEANRELQRVGRYRSLFLQRMSHELRTPLTSLLGFAEILLEHEALSAAQRRYCERIQASGLQLHTSIKQLVDLSRLEAGQTELFLHDFSAREMLRESCAAVGRLAQKQGVQLDCEIAPELGPIVSDEGKLRQVLYNFLAHAIGRSPGDATVAVRANLVAADRFQIEIADDGEPLSDPAHIFNPVDIDTPSENGTNMNELGLVIAHRLMAALGGDVALDTKDGGRGLVVRLTLPTRPTN
ncbi:MAG TPA: HAMP domain-containing sensor histidine kinase [Pyrinomonadaceae bacterium]|jgi:signal transduction histidine kinase